MTIRKAFALSLIVALIPLQASADTFVDDDGSVHENAIEAIAEAGLTRGCNPPENNRYCPDDPVTRGEAAAFLARALGLPSTNLDYFFDDDGHIFERAVDSLAAGGITQGCNPPFNTRFCPDATMTRGAMAALLARGLLLSFSDAGRFIDTEGTLFENAIDKIAAAGITKGCNPPSNTRFCPDQDVSRAQMATFLTRAFDIDVPQSTTDSGGGGEGSTSSDSSHHHPAPVGQTDGTITGNACPCTVTGTVQLVGRVSLQGDLMVMGGTLIARPGVEVEGNGHQIMFMDGARADFQGTPVFTWSDNGSKVNLERDITFNNMRRIMFHDGAGKSTLRFFSVTNSGSSELGDYPLHWHLNGDSVRGTLVEGVVVLNGKHHAFVPHGSHGITFKDTIAKNTVDDAYWWDPPCSNDPCEERRDRRTSTTDNSNDIVYDHALADGVQTAAGSKGHRLTAFMLGAGSGNVVRNSAAINVSGGKDCSGFHWPEPANQNVGGNVWHFEDNFSQSSNCHGLFSWQNDSNNHVINGFAGSGISHGAYGNKYEYRNVDVPYLEVHAAGWMTVGGQIGTVYTRRHRNEGSPTVMLENVDIDRFVIQNADNDGDVPGHYVLKNTGLSCSDIEYDAVVSGTTVVIDGSAC